MKKPSNRSLRLATEIQKSVSKIISLEISNKQLAMVTISDVEVTSDLTHAKIYVTFLAIGDQNPDNSYQLELLNGYTSMIRHTLGKEIPNLRVLPTIKFYFDQSLEVGMKMGQLVDQVIKADKNK